MRTPKTFFSLRCDKYENGLASIYWRERMATGKTSQPSFYWGKLPTERLEKFLAWLNDPTRNNRKRICRMVGLSTLPIEKLQDSEFLKKEIFEPLEKRQRLGRGFNKPGRLTPKQIAEVKEAVKNGMKKLSAIAKDTTISRVEAANRLREMGKVWEGLTGHRRFFMRDYVKFQAELPEGSPAAFWRLALSAWRNNPEPISDYWQAAGIIDRAESLFSRH